MLFWLTLGHFWCSVVTSATFSSNLSNFFFLIKKNTKKKKLLPEKNAIILGLPIEEISLHPEPQSLRKIKKIKKKKSKNFIIIKKKSKNTQKIQKHTKNNI